MSLNREQAKRNENFISHYNRFKDKIYVYFLYRVNFDQKVAEDLTSEVFLKALKSFERFDVAKSFQSWIYSISRYHLINYYKVSGRQIPLDEAKNISLDNKIIVETSLALEQVIKTINQLGESYREPLLMRYIEGLSYKEIALILGKEAGAVRTQISRGRAKLKKTLNLFK